MIKIVIKLSSVTAYQAFILQAMVVEKNHNYKASMSDHLQSYADGFFTVVEKTYLFILSYF